MASSARVRRDSSTANEDNEALECQKLERKIIELQRQRLELIAKNRLEQLISRTKESPLDIQIVCNYIISK